MTSVFRYIDYKQIKGTKPGPHLLITAGVHGDEYEPIFTVLRLIREMEGKYFAGTLTLVSVVNQAAFSRAARTGEDGLDLARICPGKPDGSITEKAAYEICTLIRQADYLIDLHTGGNAYQIAPLAGYMLHASEEVLSKQRIMAQAFNLPIIWGTTSHLEGRTLSVARDVHIPAIYTEYGGGGGSNPQIIEKLITGCFNVMRSLGMTEGTLPENEVVYTVEDHTENSGHLQIMHPSPANGIFEPEVNLGEVVKKGQPIGKILNLRSETVVMVPAARDGVVFLLRAIPSVKKGEALGGILPIPEPGKRVLV